MTDIDLATFLTLPIEHVRPYAPQTIVFAPGGTRRQAEREGIAPEHYSDWAIGGLAVDAGLWAAHGVRHIIVPTLGTRQLGETRHNYNAQVISWIAQQSVGDALAQAGQTHGFKIRLLGPATRSHPALADAAAQLRGRAADAALATLWMYVVYDDAEPWQEILETAVATGFTKRADLLQALYGERIPPAQLFVGFGRLTLHPQLMPPLLFDDELRCYWTQRAGHRMTSRMIRRILYDAVFARQRDMEERALRYDYVDELGQRWDSESIMGVGSRLRGFWFPDTFPQV